MSVTSGLAHRLHDEELHLLARLRALRRVNRVKQPRAVSVGQVVADKVASIVGSWRFILIQSGLLAVWIALNLAAYIQHWDPYPFILLNLALSFQAAYTAPIIMMSQNRQSEIDRHAAESDFAVNQKAELEIELLHQKVDELREKEIVILVETIREFQAELRSLRQPSAGG